MAVRLYIIFDERKDNTALPWWLDEARGVGFDAEILYADTLTVAAGDGGVCVMRAGKRLPLPDAVLVRGYSLEVARLYGSLGVAVFNTPEAMELCRNKFRTHVALTMAGVPTPPTLLPPPGTPLVAPVRQLGTPYILKPITGSKGEGVRLVGDDAAGTIPSGFIAQRFVATSKGRDIRVWVVGGKAVAAVERSNPGALVSNYAAGGSARIYDDSARDAVYDLAEKAACACGLFFAGVDVLYGADDSYTVCEVNGNAGFRTLSLCHGLNLPRTVLKAMMEELRGGTLNPRPVIKYNG